MGAIDNHPTGRAINHILEQSKNVSAWSLNFGSVEERTPKDKYKLYYLL